LCREHNYILCAVTFGAPAASNNDKKPSTLPHLFVPISFIALHTHIYICIYTYKRESPVFLGKSNPNSPLKAFSICHLCFAPAAVVVIYVIINIFPVMFAVGIVTPSTLSSLPRPHILPRPLAPPT